MQGRGSLRNSIQQLASVTGADVVGISKHPTTSDKATTIAVFDKSAGKLFSPRQWVPYASEIMGSAAQSAASGSLWAKSEAENVDLLKSRSASSNVPVPKEVVSITIENVAEAFTTIEFQYNFYPRPSGIMALKVLAQHITQAWQNRIPGVSVAPIVCALDDDQKEIQIAGKQILTHENPYGLSKTEFRICFLLRSGAKIKNIAKTLGSQEKTVRSQLSSIYSKIGVNGQMELLHRLISSTDQQETLVHARH